MPRRSWPPSRPSTAADPPREQLIQENELLRHENAQLWDWLFQTIEFPPAKQHEFAVTALAMGLSLNQILVLLTILLGDAGGSQSLDASIAGSKPRAWPPGAVLKRLDRAARTLVLVGCLDEIFFRRRPVLVGVEPTSMVWFLGTKADDCRGRPGRRPCDLDGVAYVVSDAGTGLQAGIAADATGPPQAERSPAGERAGCLPHPAGGAAGLADAAGVGWNGPGSRPRRPVEPSSGPNVRAATRRGPGRRAGRAWKKVETALRRYEEAETAWRSAESALNRVSS